MVLLFSFKIHMAVFIPPAIPCIQLEIMIELKVNLLNDAGVMIVCANLKTSYPLHRLALSPESRYPLTDNEKCHH